MQVVSRRGDVQPFIALGHEQRVQRIELPLVPQYVSCHVYANERIEAMTQNVNEKAEFSSVTKFDWSNKLR